MPFQTVAGHVCPCSDPSVAGAAQKPRFVVVNKQIPLLIQATSTAAGGLQPTDHSQGVKQHSMADAQTTEKRKLKTWTQHMPRTINSLLHAFQLLHDRTKHVVPLHDCQAVALGQGG
jgi:hypothetical protein